MTKKQEQAYLLAIKINEDHERKMAREKRHAAFWEGLKKVDYAIGNGYDTPKGRIRQLVDDVAAQFDKGEVPTSVTCWNTIEYIGSFDMEYSYTGVVNNGIDKDTGLDLLEVIFLNDNLDEVSLTEQLRKSLTNYLSAAAALAKRAGSTTYSDWIRLILDLNFAFRHTCRIFGTGFPFEAFKNRIEALLPRLWAENLVARRDTHTCV